VILDVDLSARPPAVRLLEQDALRKFHVAVHGVPTGVFDGLDVAVRAAGAGRLDGAEVLVPVDWVRAQAQACGRYDEAWEKDFTAMVEYSDSRGWIEENGTCFRVHCEWEPRARVASAEVAKAAPGRSGGRDNKALVLDFVRLVLHEGRVREGFEKYCAREGYIQHTPDIKDGWDGAVEFLSGLWETFPQFSYDVRHVLTDDENDLVLVHAFARNAADPDDRGAAIFDLFRLNADGLIIEHWDAVQHVPEVAANPQPMF